jgi:hypothetical protein
MRRDLEQYLGKLGTMIVDASIRFAVNYTYQVFSMGPGANALGWDQKKYENIPAPSIDSETGRMDNVSPEKIIHGVPEHSCYLMQTIKIGSSEALVFFDRGANIHIIDGSLAEKEGLQKVSSNPINLTVVGGSKVRSNHGTFRFNLGPGERGEYHEVVCVGMDNVSGGFGTYDLTEVCQEYLDQAGDKEKAQALPEKIGGSRVHLLLGIKNTNLDPVLIKVLPSGVAVYLSPFKDIYGSRLIFAGPHRSFTKGSDERCSEMSNAVFLIRERMIEQMEPGSVDGFAGEYNSPGHESITALGEGKAKQGIYSGNVVVNAVGCNSPNRDLSIALDSNTSEEDYGVFKARVPIAKFTNDEGLDWSTETDRFSATLAKTGRGVAELLMNPVSRSWRA